MLLYVLQHGETLPERANPDPSLSEKGRLDVERLAAFLSRHRIKVESIYHSRQTAARQTAQWLQWAVSPIKKPQRRAGLGPDDPVAPLTEELTACSEDVLIASDLLFTTRLVGQLLTDREDASSVVFAPGTIVCLEKQQDGKWCILWMVPSWILALEE